MEICNNLEVPLPPEQAWPLLLDIPRIAPCVPGAELLEAIDDKTYKGKVSIRLGPVALSFIGTVKIDTLDPAANRARIIAKGADSKGRGGADAVVQFALEPTETGTKINVLTDLNLIGSVAQYGRASSIIQGVAAQLTAQFSNNLRAMLESEDELTAASKGAAALSSPSMPKPQPGAPRMVTSPPLPFPAASKPT
jgi:carbon monoxide dehydrogenase subunit G